MKKRWMAGLSLCCFLLLFVLCFHWLSGVIPYVDERQNSVWQDLYRNPDTVSYLFLGSSHVYCGIDPMEIQDKTGKKAVLISSGMQTLTESYYCMEEALRYQKPEVVAVDLYAAYKEFTEVNYTNLDCIRLSPAKVRLAREGFSDTRLIDALFPLIREHSNWKDFDNLKANLEGKRGTYTYGFSGIDSRITDEQYQGYFDMAVSAVPFTLRQQDEEMLHRMQALCEKKGVRLVFLVVPWLEEFVQRIPYASFLTELERVCGDVTALTAEEYHEIGLSRETFIEDKVSDNQHLNLQGAKAYTDYLIQTVLE